MRVLIVDDEAPARALLREYLAAHADAEAVGEAENGFEAVKQVVDLRPDVILLDIQMGSENGLDAVRPIKSLSRNTRVFMFTTLADEYARVRARENGASGFLLKRCPIEEIVQTIRQPGEFDGLPVIRRRRAASSNSSPANCPSDKRPQTISPSLTLSRSQTKSDVFRRALGVLRSFWN